MIKIKSIQFPQEHSILGGLELNFCDNNGTPADTIIIAGENGTGKTTILEEIYKIMKYECDCKDLKLEVLCDGVPNTIKYCGENEQHGIFNGEKKYYVTEVILNENSNEKKYQELIKEEIKFSSIYSTVNINFIRNKNGIELSTVEKNVKSIKSDANIANEVVNFLLRTRADDTEKLNRAYENGNDLEKIKPQLDRFKNAFNYMFENKLKVEGVEQNNILFKTTQENKPFFIDNLSSGEKQIVFRGAFLLKDKEALNGAVVLIDEPEISMHPKWQQKILDYYRKLFLDNNKQTSQIIVSTHSNFIIENALKLDNCVIIALQENNQVKKIIKRDGTFILPAVTAEEINYHVFNITSIGYHIQLFGYLHSLMEKHFSKDMNIKEVDDKIKDNKSLLYKNVLQDSKGNSCEWEHNFVDTKGKPKTTTYYTICCFIRNAIDHPDNLPSQTKKEYEDDLQYSIEILIDLIRLNISIKDYYIQLFGYFQKITGINEILDIDNKIKNNQSLLSKNVLQDSKGSPCQWIYGSTNYETICCFIRNAIDHRDNLPNQTKTEYTDDDLKYSIEILIELIKLAKSGSLK
ncbi:MAG: AAA family ATPase [Neisseriaceae bacterium]|nr:AAA family ATPase [Neisseriaceae bacterium]